MNALGLGAAALSRRSPAVTGAVGVLWSRPA
jgi:hypothetical protein